MINFPLTQCAQLNSAQDAPEQHIADTEQLAATAVQHKIFSAHLNQDKSMLCQHEDKAQKSPDQSFVNDNMLHQFNQLNNEADKIKAWLRDGNTLSFSFNGEEYRIAYNANVGRFQAYNSRDKKVDRVVQIGTDQTVPGFIEVGGLKGLNKNNRLYLGVDPNNTFCMIEASAYLDKNKGDGDHLDTLLEDGTYHYTAQLPNEENNPARPDDGVDIFVFDDGALHGEYVSSTAQYFAGETIQVDSIGVMSDKYIDPEAILPEEVSRAKVVDIAIKLANLLKTQDPAWEQNPALLQTIEGVEQTANDFAQGEEKLGDYLLLEDTLNLLKLTGTPEVQTQAFALKSASVIYLKNHRTNYPSGDPVIDSVNIGSIALDLRTRLVIFQASPEQDWYTPGYAPTLQSLAALSQQIGAMPISALAKDFHSEAVIGAELNIQAVLDEGLGQAGLIDTAGNIIPVEGFDQDNQPVRIINISLGAGVAEVIGNSAFFDVLDILPAQQDSALYQSLNEFLPEDMQQLLAQGDLTLGDAARAATANALVALLQDPSSDLGQTVNQLNQQTHTRVEQLLDANILIIMSAGNEGNDIVGALPEASKNLLATENMIVVGASDDLNTPDIADDILAAFSSAGADFVIDGVDVISTNGEVKTGTSLAAPTVAGILARLLDEAGQYSAREVLNALSNPAIYADIQGTEQDGMGILMPESLSEVFNSIGQQSSLPA